MKYPVAISVVMPCFNYDRYVSVAIESILNQTFTNFEFIIVNDGSTDNSHEEITRHLDPRIRYIRFEKNCGNFPARNAGMRMARGKYICVMDADDISQYNRLAIQFAFLERHKHIGAIGSQGAWMNEDGSPAQRIFHRPVCSWRQMQVLLLLDSQCIHPSLMFRKSLLEKHNLFYNEHYHTASDYDFIVRCASFFPVCNLSDILIRYRRHNNQISKKSRGEQRNFADEIRVAQLKKLLVDATAAETRLYLKVINRSLFDEMDELAAASEILNTILEKNKEIRMYDPRLLYNLFDFRIAGALEEMKYSDPQEGNTILKASPTS